MRRNKYRTFEEARMFVRGLNIKGCRGWREWCQSGDRPADIHGSPDAKYRNDGWISWNDFLGTKKTTTKKVSEEGQRRNSSQLPLSWSKRNHEFLHTKEIPEHLPQFAKLRKIRLLSEGGCQEFWPLGKLLHHEVFTKITVENSKVDDLDSALAEYDCASMEGFCDEVLGIKIRTAQNIRTTYRKFVIELRITAYQKEELTRLGRSKCYEISRVADKDNIDRWIKIAKEQKFTALHDLISSDLNRLIGENASDTEMLEDLSDDGSCPMLDSVPLVDSAPISVPPVDSAPISVSLRQEIDDLKMISNNLLTLGDSIAVMLKQVNHSITTARGIGLDRKPKQVCIEVRCTSQSCNGFMTERHNSQNRSTFYGCTTWPSCKETMTIYTYRKRYHEEECRITGEVHKPFRPWI